MENNDEIRKAGDYEITHSIHIGDRELVMGENSKAEDGQFYFVGDCTRNELFERFENCLISNDFLELADIFSKRLQEQVQKLKDEREKTHSAEMITSVMCCPGSERGNYKDKVIVIKPSVLRPEYRSAVYQLYLATGGNGLNPGGMGTAAYCTNLYTGKRTRFERYDVAGIIKPEQFPAWAKERLSVVREIENTPHCFEYNHLHFVPVGNIPKGIDLKQTTENIKSDRDMGFSKYKWAEQTYSHEDFYKASGSSNADVFKCLENGKNYLPGENELFEYMGDIQKHEKNKNRKEPER